MSWRRVETNRYAQQRVDPYFEWARATGFAHFFREGQEQRFPVVIELADISAAHFAAGKWHAPDGWRELISVPRMYLRPPAGLAQFSFCSATVSQAFFSRLAADPLLRKAIRRIELSLPIENYNAEDMATVAPPRTAAGVVTGVIDDGIAFAHERFRAADGTTRVQFFWSQDARPPAGAVAYGREFLKAGVGPRAIDAVMTASTHAGMVDEDRVYRVTRQLAAGDRGHKPVAWRIGHGTHVMDLAAGYDPRLAPADRPIIGVQLPVHATADTSGAHFGRYALDGLYYILQRSELLASAPPPVVVNISYGFIAGPHDGSSIVEAAIDQIIALRPAPFAVVLPAGNSHLGRCHARVRPASGARATLPWRIQPEDYTPSYLEIWLPHTAAGSPPARVRFRIRPPAGAWCPWVNEGESWYWQPAGPVVCEAVYHNSVAPGRNRNMILVAVAPSAALQAGGPVAPAGLWEVEIENLGERATIDAWIQRDDSPFGYPRRGRQSYFDDPQYERYDDAGREVATDNASLVKRRGMVSSISTGSRTVVVGGFHRKDWRAAHYSAGGPVIHPPGRGAPNLDGPDAMAVSDDSVVHAGVLAAGTRSGSVVAMFGTSVAAPQITRWIADRMASGQPHDRAAVAQFAAAGAAAGFRSETNPPPGALPKPPAERSGRGRIEGPPRIDRGIER